MTTIGGKEFHDLPVQKYWQPPASWTPEKKKQTTRDRIFSGEWTGARKMDGAFYRFCKYDNGDMELLGRSKGVEGDYINKLENVPHLKTYFNSLPNGTCLIGEIVFPDHEGSKVTTTIMGCLPEKAIARQKENPIHYYIFDVLAYDGQSLLDKTMEERVNKLKEITVDMDYIHFADYYEGPELWDKLQEILAEGGEGIVMTRKSALYQPDKRPSKDCQKCKKEIQETLDCVIMGANAPTKIYTGKELKTWKYWLNNITGEFICDESARDRGGRTTTDTYELYSKGEAYEPITKNYYLNMAGSLKIGLYKDGNLIHFGDLSGLTEEVLTNWKNYVGKVAEVGGMQYDDVSKRIRHPKLIGWRTDKNPTDCTWDQLS